VAKTPKLRPGRYFGQTLRRRAGEQLVVSEVRFPPRVRVPRHSHDRSIFNFVLAGAYVEYSDHRSIECRPPVLLFHRAGEIHWERFSRAGARCLTVEFDPAWVEDVERDRDRVDRTLCFARGEWTWVAAPIRQELYLRDDLTPMVVEAYVRILLAAGLRHEGRSGAPPSFLERARSILDDRFPERFQLGDIAREVQVHPSHLARAFRRHYRTSPGEYVRRLRVDYACRELASRERTLAEIAQSAGFADQSHFTRTFRKLTGTTPARYRAEVLGP
jgi:AraC family transcriptional regulator